MKWSPYQEAVFEWVRHGQGNAIVKAVAGSGKTTTIVEALGRGCGNDSMVVAFNKAIAEELQARAAAGIRVGTFHSVCLRALTRGKRLRVDGEKVRVLARALAGEMNIPTGVRGDYISSGCALVSKAKNLGIGIVLKNREAVWQEIAERFDLESDHNTLEFARQLLEQDLKQKSVVDFDDMLYFAAYYDLRFDPVGLLAVDETQDLNPIERALLPRLMARDGRLIAVGDPCQAIYAFRGADAHAFPEIAAEFKCREFPLTVSYRCSRAVVRYAQEMVDYIEAAPHAIEGEVCKGVRPNFFMLEPGSDVILCRSNAPLLKMALSLIRHGIGAKIRGRDIAQGLKRLVSRSGAETLTELQDSLDDWRDYERAKHLAKDREDLAASIDDQHDCIQAVIDSLPSGRRTPGGVLDALDDLFRDKDGVLELSSIHRAKGCEWERVYILRPDLMPAAHATSPEDIEQERNLEYVARTRAKFGVYVMHKDVEMVE